MPKNNTIVDLSKELNTEINKLQDALSKLDKDMKLIGNEELWTGEGAYQVFKSGFGNLDHNRQLLGNILKCSIYLESKISDELF